MDTGSGAQNAVKTEMINKVKRTINIPLIVGGGINTQQQLELSWKSGADIVVVGTCIENNFKKMFGFKKLNLSN